MRLPVLGKAGLAVIALALLGAALPSGTGRAKPAPVPQAPFPAVEYQGPPPAYLAQLPSYTDAQVAALLRERTDDPQGLPEVVSREAAEFTLTQLLRMVPRVLVTNARGAQTRRLAHVLLSPSAGTDVFGTAVVMQYDRNGHPTTALESRVQFTIGQASRMRLLYTQRPPFKVTMAREDDGATLVAYDPASASAALNNPEGALTVRYLTSLAGGPSAQYVWVNNLAGAYRAEARTNTARGPRQEHAVTGTPWFNDGSVSVFQLLHQMLRVVLWDRNLPDGKYYDVIAVLSAAEGGYHDGGISLQLLAFGVDWQAGQPRFVPGHLRADLTLTYPADGPEQGTLHALTLAIHPESDFQGAGAVGAVPLFNPSAGERMSLTDLRATWAIYNHPYDPDGNQRVMTADMVALTKGVRNTAARAWGIIPYPGF